MKKAELKKRFEEISGKVFEARVEAEELLNEVEDDQGRIPDDDIDILNSFVSACESTEEVARQI